MTSKIKNTPEFWEFVRNAAGDDNFGGDDDVIDGMAMAALTFAESSQFTPPAPQERNTNMTYTTDLYIDNRCVATFRDRGHCYDFISAYLHANRGDEIVRQDEGGERVYFWDAANGRVDIR